MAKKQFVIKFDVQENNIQTSMQTNNVSPQEALGLLDMAKDQILEGVKKNRKNIFHASKKNEEKK